MRRGEQGYTSWRRDMIARGLWGDQFTPVDVTRAHIEKLRDAGLSLTDIARVSGVKVGTLVPITNGTTKKVWCETEDAVLAVSPGSIVPGRVPAFRITRRLQALGCLGYSLRWIASEAGVSVTSLERLMRGDWAAVGRSTYLPVAAVFDRLQFTPRVGETQVERAAISQTVGRARRLGFSPTAAWDDIDDWGERPKGVGRDEVAA